MGPHELHLDHQCFWGRCPSHHLIPTYTNLGASGTADYLTLLQIFLSVEYQKNPVISLVESDSTLPAKDIFSQLLRKYEPPKWDE